VIFGFIHSLDASGSENIDLKVDYTLTVRGKNLDEQEWHYQDPSTNTVETRCKKDYSICTIFPVGFVPFIEKDMYDVMI
jgi:hypothetical protein